MKLVTFSSRRGDRLGALAGGKVVDLNAAYALYLKSRGERRAGAAADALLPGDMVGFLSLGDDALRAMRQALYYALASRMRANATDGRGHRVVYGTGDVRLRPPVPHPPKVICIGLNYVDHCKESGLAVPESPFFFIKPWTAIVGPEDLVYIPKMAKVNRHVDYELELTIVIGRKARWVSEERAYDAVAGYTIMNDISARDFFPPEMVPMKGHDSFAPLGPCITLKDEIGDVDDLDVQLRVNGQVRQDSNTRNFVFKVPQVVSYLSQIMTLEPGDVISTGTPGGVGWKRTPPLWLQPGDVVEAEVENIGVLRNTLATEV
jgi:acylpyruvate hydrolase